MRKKFLTIGLSILMTLSFAACCSNKSTVKEYNIDDFLKVYTKAEKSVEKETKYWSDDEKDSDKYADVINKCAEKNKLSANQTIQLRGKFTGIIIQSLRIAEDSDSANYFLCSFKLGKSKRKIPSNVALLNPGDNINVEITIFSNYKDDTGKEHVSLNSNNCKVISPDLSKVKYKDNVKDIIGSSETSRVMGEVTSVIENPYSEKQKKEISDSVDYSVSGESEFSSAINYCTHIIELNLEDSDQGLLCFVNKNCAQIPEEGDKISIIGEPFSCSDMNGLDANESPIYIFK